MDLNTQEMEEDKLATEEDVLSVVELIKAKHRSEFDQAKQLPKRKRKRDVIFKYLINLFNLRLKKVVRQVIQKIVLYLIFAKKNLRYVNLRFPNIKKRNQRS